jgi:hypothetical protein
MPDRQKNIKDCQAWAYLTNLNNVTITCYSSEQVLEAFQALANHKMIMKILKVVPKFDSDHNELLVYFDYFCIMICEARIRLMDPSPLRT